MNQKILIGFLAAGAFSLVACSSNIKKADIASGANPTEEIARLERDMQAGSEKHVDLLAQEDFEKARKHLKEAREDLKDKESQKEVLEEVAYAQAYLNRATTRAESKRASVQEVLNAREAAVQMGVAENPALHERLKKIDKDVQDETDDFKKSLSAQNYARFQRDYLNLELDGIQHKNLGSARSQVKDAEDKKAEKMAPQTLKQAMISLKSAENLILANRHNSGSYQSAVDKANQDAATLTEVMKIMRANKGSINEANALRIVQQNRTIAGLKGNLGESRGEVARLNSSLEEQSATLSAAEKQVQLQKALDEARQKFSRDEAEVYQQGDKLLIRLKKMNFASGNAALPPESIELLSKVQEVAMGLNPSDIVVEGHTDSTGSAQVNRDLSEKRAEAVASYFESNLKGDLKIESEGYGFEKPIASNKTKQGRMQNRRVDVIVTPSVARAPSSGSEEAPASTQE